MKRLKGKTLEVGDFLDGFGKEEVVRSTDILKLFASFGVKLEKKGKSYVGRCPWHDDKTPSLSVDAEKKLYNCFGCGESGDVFTLVEKMKNCSFREALEYLRREDFRYYEKKETYPKETVIQQAPQDETERVTVNISPSTNDLEKINAEEVQATLPEEDRTNGILKEVMDWYSGKLNSNAEAKAYLEQRALFDAELLTGFGIGFADGSLLEVIGEERKAELVSIGILNEKEGRVWEHFGNCVVIPLLDENGQIAGVYGRSIDDKSSFKHRYLKGTHRGIFNRKASAVYNEIILTESIFDALSLIKLGFDNTQSIYGTNGFTEEHLKQLKDDRVKTVILALDNDEAGRSAAAKLKEKLSGEGFAVKEIYPLSLPNGAGAKDWNEYLTASTDLSVSAEHVRKMTAEAVVKTDLYSSNKDFKASKENGNYLFETNGLLYRVSGVKEFFAVNLRVNIKVTPRRESADEQSGERNVSHYDSIDLYSARSRSSFSSALSKTFDAESVKISKDLISILEYLEEERDRSMTRPKSETAELTEEERELGRSLLCSPALFEDILSDMDSLGYVGEELNKLLLYIAASSRKLDDPISVLILSESASGKSMLIDTVVKLMPEEDVVSATSLSEQALNYIEDLTHKFVTLGEIVHSDAVDHQIREMLSGKELSRLVTVKDEKTGKMSAKLVKTPAVVSLVMSGTGYDINPENASRCFLVNTDESREQTRRIHNRQREKYTLERHREKKETVPQIINKHKCAQRMLRKIAVMNPLARHLDFPDLLMRARRDHDRFIDLIVCCAHLRQFQKEVKTARLSDGMSESLIEYIECDIEDYREAYRMMVNGVLSSTMRELPLSVLEFYDKLREMVRESAKKKNLEAREVSFTQRDVREYTGYGNTWVKKNTRVLIDYEYVMKERGGRERSKGLYRLRGDEPISALDFSMIPTPEKMEELLKNGKLGTKDTTGSVPSLEA